MAPEQTTTGTILPAADVWALGLIVFFTNRPLVELATAAALSGSLLVSYTRARGEAVGEIRT